ncbi:glucokinase [Desulfobaculum bizertense]|uniref:glucokinase n=1 Tax=Desulfobaculum bizertense TaxID=376490 RepID=UPI001F3C74C2|nr:glucokinase [Desulfobaculum bizertense]UIJ38077.1 glucokinase [Desulfobaculum bizertense]
MHSVLAVDIGGTNSRFAAFTVNAYGVLEQGETLWLETRRFASFQALMQGVRDANFALSPHDADCVGLAVAGPVQREGRYSNPPNIPWDIDLVHRDAELLRDYVLLNDFTAQAYACLTPALSDALQVLPGRIVPRATRAVVGAGTGLGKAALVPDESGVFHVMPTEGGHAVFPFISRDEFEFMDFVMQRTGRQQVIGDLVVSGPGLSLVHEYLTGERLAPSEVAEGLQPQSRTLAWAARFYGRACRNFVLNTLALGGLYIAGGVAAKTPQLVTCPAFRSAFHWSETHGEMLEEIPVWLNANEHSGLWGAAFAALRHLGVEQGAGWTKA